MVYDYFVVSCIVLPSKFTSPVIMTPTAAMLIPLMSVMINVLLKSIGIPTTSMAITAIRSVFIPLIVIDLIPDKSILYVENNVSTMTAASLALVILTIMSSESIKDAFYLLRIPTAFVSLTVSYKTMIDN